MPSIVHCQSVSQIYRSGFWLRPKLALTDVSFAVEPGRVLGLLGANGAGKSTLIHVLVGLRRPASGEARIVGHPAHGLEARTHVGYLPERPFFYEHLKGSRVLEVLGSVSGLGEDRLKSRIPECLARVGLGSAGDVAVSGYSKGMMQRLGIAQALLHDPKLLVLDEPMSGLDPKGRAEMREIILSLRGEGRAVIFSSHVLPDVEALCDDVLMLRKGAVTGFGPLSKFASGHAARSRIVVSGASKEALAKLKWAHKTEARPDGLAWIELEPGARLASAHLSALEKIGAEVESISVDRPSLEDVVGAELYS